MSDVVYPGHGKGLDADLLDGLHAQQILDKARMYSGGGPIGVSPASYIIYKEGNLYKALDCSTGTIAYSGTDASAVIQAAIDALPSGTIILKELSLPETITLKADVKIVEMLKAKRQRQYIQLSYQQ